MGRDKHPPITTEEALKQATREANQALRDLKVAQKESRELLAREVRAAIQQIVDREVRILLQELRDYVAEQKTQTVTDLRKVLIAASKAFNRHLDKRLLGLIGDAAAENEHDRLGTFGMLDQILSQPNSKQALGDIRALLREMIDRGGSNADLSAVTVTVIDGHSAESQTFSISERDS